MALTKTIRLSSEQAEWLAQTSTSSGISENRIVTMLIDRACSEGLRLTVTLGREVADATVTLGREVADA